MGYGHDIRWVLNHAAALILWEKVGEGYAAWVGFGHLPSKEKELPPCLMEKKPLLD